MKLFDEYTGQNMSQLIFYYVSLQLFCVHPDPSSRADLLHRPRRLRSLLDCVAFSRFLALRVTPSGLGCKHVVGVAAVQETCEDFLRYGFASRTAQNRVNNPEKILPPYAVARPDHRTVDVTKLNPNFDNCK